MSNATSIVIHKAAPKQQSPWMSAPYTPAGKSGKGSGDKGKCKGTGKSVEFGPVGPIEVRRAMPTPYDPLCGDPSTQPMVETRPREVLAVARNRPTDAADVGISWDYIRGRMESVKDTTQQFDELMMEEFANPDMATPYVPKNLWRRFHKVSVQLRSAVRALKYWVDEREPVERSDTDVE